jgi:hypothetical protein
VTLMAEALTLPTSVVDGFAQHSPSEEDVNEVTEALRKLARSPHSGVQIPFSSLNYKDIYVAWTPDKRWRIVFRPKGPSGLDVLSIDPES